MISKHSHEQSDRGEGVEVVQNEPYEDPNHGNGQLTEKRVYLNSKLPSWARAVVPKIFYVTEKAWNYYPYTITEYTGLWDILRIKFSLISRKTVSKVFIFA
nr:PREDICTED: cytoplasmic phosphatidylinositol transfer protein 1-like [Haliaeetus albicilla]